MTALAEAPAPGSAEWLRLMSASKVAAVLGVSPYDSPYSLWCQMKGLVVRDDQTKEQARGHYLEAGVLAWWRDQQVVDLDDDEVIPQYVARLDDWGIATCDALAASGVAVEVKTTGSWDEWGVEGTDEVPAHYYAQALWQLACLGEDVNAVEFAVLGPRLDFRLYRVVRDDALIGAIIARCRDFWESLAADVPPLLDDHVATLATLRRQHADIEDGTEAVVPDDVAARYVAADLAAKAADAALTAAKSELLAAAGTANYIVTDAGQRVARRQPSGRGVALYRVAKHITTTPEGVAA